MSSGQRDESSFESGRGHMTGGPALARPYLFTFHSFWVGVLQLCVPLLFQGPWLGARKRLARCSVLFSGCPSTSRAETLGENPCASGPSKGHRNTRASAKPDGFKQASKAAFCNFGALYARTTYALTVSCSLRRWPTLQPTRRMSTHNFSDLLGTPFRI